MQNVAIRLLSPPLQKCSVPTVVMVHVKKQLETAFVLITNESS